MENVICEGCKKDNDQGDVTCWSCGRRLPVLAQPEPPLHPSNFSAHADNGDPFETARATVTVKFAEGSPIRLEQGDRLVIGRESDNRTVASLCGDNIEGHHAEIYLSNESAFIIDRNSLNGTFVNGERLEKEIPLPVTSTVLVQLAYNPPLLIKIELEDVE